jgi:hypothetical protein
MQETKLALHLHMSSAGQAAAAIGVCVPWCVQTWMSACCTGQRRSRSVPAQSSPPVGVLSAPGASACAPAAAA